MVFAPEVADGSLEYDLTTKLKVYAAAGVPRYVVVDLRNQVVLIQSEFRGSSYRCVRRFIRSDTLTLPTAHAAEVDVPVNDLIAPKFR